MRHVIQIIQIYITTIDHVFQRSTTRCGFEQARRI